MKLGTSLAAIALLGLTACGGGDSIEEVNAKINRDLIERGCAPAFGDGSLNEAINEVGDALADNSNEPTRDNNGEFCPGGEEREARLAAAEAKAQEDAAREAAAEAERAVTATAKQREAELFVARNQLTSAREGLAQTVEDYRGSLPDAETAFASTRQGFQDLLAEALATFEKWDEPVPAE